MSDTIINNFIATVKGHVNYKDNNADNREKVNDICDTVDWDIEPNAFENFKL